MSVPSPRRIKGDLTVYNFRVPRETADCFNEIKADSVSGHEILVVRTIHCLSGNDFFKLHVV